MMVLGPAASRQTQASHKGEEMCVEIVYQGVVIGTMDRLREIVGDRCIAVRSGYSLDAYLGGGCLCPLDLRATARELGCRMVASDVGMRYRLVPKKKNPAPPHA